MAFSSSSAKGDEWLNCEVCGLTFKNEKHYSIHCGGMFHANRVTASMRTSQNSAKTGTDSSQTYSSSNNPSYWTGLQQSFPDSQQIKTQDKAKHSQAQRGAASSQTQQEFVSYPLGKHPKPSAASSGEGYEGLYGMPGFGWSNTRPEPGSDPKEFYSDWQLQQSGKSASKGVEPDPWENSYYSTSDNAGYPVQGYAAKKSQEPPPAKAPQKSDVPAWYKMIEPSVIGSQKTEPYKSAQTQAPYGSSGDDKRYGNISKRPGERESDWNSPQSSLDITEKLRQLRDAAFERSNNPVDRFANTTIGNVREQNRDDVSAKGSANRFRETDSYRNSGYYDGQGGQDSRKRDDLDRRRDDLDRRDSSRGEDVGYDSYRIESSYYKDDQNIRRESFATKLLEKQRDDHDHRVGPADRSQRGSGYAEKRDSAMKPGRNDELSSKDSARAEFERKILQMQQSKAGLMPWEEPQDTWGKKDSYESARGRPPPNADWNGGGLGGGKIDTKTGRFTRDESFDGGRGSVASISNDPKNSWNLSSTVGQSSVGPRPGQGSAGLRSGQGSVWDDRQWSGETSMQRPPSKAGQSAGNMSSSKESLYGSAGSGFVPPGKSGAPPSILRGSETLRQGGSYGLGKEQGPGNLTSMNNRFMQHSDTDQSRLDTESDQWRGGRPEGSRSSEKIGNISGYDRPGIGRGLSAMGVKNSGSGNMGDERNRGALFPGVLPERTAPRLNDSGIEPKSSYGKPVAPNITEKFSGTLGFTGSAPAGRGFPGKQGDFGGPGQGARGISGLQNLGTVPGASNVPESFSSNRGLGRGTNFRASEAQTRQPMGEQNRPNQPNQMGAPIRSQSSTELPSAALVSKSNVNQRAIPSLLGLDSSSFSAGTTKEARPSADSAPNKNRSSEQIKPRLPGDVGGSKLAKNLSMTGKILGKLGSGVGVEKTAVVPQKPQPTKIILNISTKSVADGSNKALNVSGDKAFAAKTLSDVASKASTSSLDKPPSGGPAKPAVAAAPTLLVTSTPQPGKTVPFSPNKPQPASLVAPIVSQAPAKSPAEAIKPPILSSKAALLPTPVSKPLGTSQTAEPGGRKALLPTPLLPNITVGPIPSKLAASGKGNSGDGGNLVKDMTSVVASDVNPNRPLGNPVCSPSKLDSKVTPAAASSVSLVKTAVTESTKGGPVTTGSAVSRPAASVYLAAPRGAAVVRQEPSKISNAPLIPAPGAQGRNVKKDTVENVDESDAALSEALGQFFSEDVTVIKTVKSVNSAKVVSSIPPSAAVAGKSVNVGSADSKAVTANSEPSVSGTKLCKDDVKKVDGVKSKSIPPMPSLLTTKTSASVEKKVESTSSKAETASKGLVPTASKVSDDKNTGMDHDPISKLAKYLPPEILKEITSGQPPKELLEKVADLLPADVLLQAVEFLQNSSVTKDIRTPSAVDSSKETFKSTSGGGSGPRIQVIAPRKGLASAGRLDGKVQLPKKQADMKGSVADLGKHDAKAMGMRKYDIDISKLMDLNFDEMLKLFQELLQDVLGSLFDDEQNSSAIDEGRILDGLSADDRDLALSVRRTTGITDISKIVHTLKILKSLDTQTILALGQLDKSVIASSLSGNKRAEAMGVTVLQQITNLLAKEDSSESTWRSPPSSADPVKRSAPMSSAVKHSGVQSLLSLDFSGPSVMPPGPAGVVRPVRMPAAAGRGLLPTPVLPQNSGFFPGQNSGHGLLPTPPEPGAFGGFSAPPPQPGAFGGFSAHPPMKRQLQSSDRFFHAGPEPKRWR